MIISIPLHGFGDVLYHSLSLNFLRKQGKNDVTIFCTNSCSEIPQIFDIEYVPLYSKLIKNSLEFNIKSEFLFWKSIRKYSGSYLFTILNDRIDNVISFVFGLKVVNNKLGNYYHINNSGIRGKINSTIVSNVSKQNPKHFFERLHLEISQFVPISKDELMNEFMKIFVDSINNSDSFAKAQRPILCVYPDAGTEARSLTEEQVAYIVGAYIDKYSIEIFSSRKFNHISGDKVVVRNFTSIKETFVNCLKYTLIFTADSFPAHFSALSGVETYVLYRSPQFKKYCEYWGSPYENVYHIENGVVYKLSKSLKAYKVNNINDNCRQIIKAMEVK